MRDSYSKVRFLPYFSGNPTTLLYYVHFPVVPYDSTIKITTINLNLTLNEDAQTI